MSDNPKKGDLRVWWIPQVPMKPFRVAVPDVKTAKLLLTTLADYDIFQYKNRIKPDYSNAGGLECFSQDDDGQWCDWYDEETGDDIDTVAPPGA
jgi:hypothetical protein